MTEAGLMPITLAAITMICDEFLRRPVEERDVIRAHVALELIQELCHGVLNEETK